MADTTTRDRIDRILRGEAIVPDTPNPIPAYYGEAATAADVHAAWIRMWDRMRGTRPLDELFYLAGIAYWAARARGEEVGPVPNAEPVQGGSEAWDEGDCVACQ